MVLPLNIPLLNIPFWHRTWVPVVSLPAPQGDMAGAVWLRVARVQSE